MATAKFEKGLRQLLVQWTVTRTIGGHWKLPSTLSKDGKIKNLTFKRIKAQ